MLELSEMFYEKILLSQDHWIVTMHWITTSIMRSLILSQQVTMMLNKVHGRAAAIVFNFDKIGSSDFEDRKIKIVSVPVYYVNEIYHSVSRKFKHMTLLVCISTSGTTLPLLLIVAHTILTDFRKHVLRNGIDVIFALRPVPYINKELFYNYIINVFLPYLTFLRQVADYANKDAIILMDLMSVYTSGRIL
jgi:hypothetical protein